MTTISPNRIVIVTADEPDEDEPTIECIQCGEGCAFILPSRLEQEWRPRVNPAVPDATPD